MKIYTASNHHVYRQNRYRFHPVRQVWQFDDGVGPWARSGRGLDGMNEEQGAAALRQMDFHPAESTHPLDTRG